VEKIVNKHAYFDYEILEDYEAGLVLRGYEVKSLRRGAASLRGARAVFKHLPGGGEELWLVGMQINPYEFARNEDYDPLRSRKILLSTTEMERIKSKLSTKGLTLVPLECYNKGDWIKVKIGLARGKKQYEKREIEKKRETDQMIQRSLKNRVSGRIN
jgi:SsrA-binding protein